MARKAKTAKTAKTTNGAPRPGRKPEPKSDITYAPGAVGTVHEKIDRAARRFQKYLKRLESFGLPADLDVATHVDSAIDHMQRAVKALCELPSDWRPLRGSVAGVALTEGMPVVVKEDRQGDYEGVNLDGLVVNKLIPGKNRVQLKNKDKVIFVVSRQHITPAEA